MIDHHLKITDNYITVNRNRVDLYEVIDWTKKNCPHYITNDYHRKHHGNDHGNDLVDFFFIDADRGKKEMAWFILRWS
jgi:hypothetical protein